MVSLVNRLETVSLGIRLEMVSFGIMLEMVVLGDRYQSVRLFLQRNRLVVIAGNDLLSANEQNMFYN